VPGSGSNSTPKGEDPPTKVQETVTANPEDKGKQVIVVPLQTRRSVSIPTMFIIGLICFLLGSLVRSLLSPADFVVVKGAGDPYIDENVDWRRLTRLIELKLTTTKDLIIGIAHV